MKIFKSDQDFIDRCDKLLTKLEDMPKFWETPEDKIQRLRRIEQRLEMKIEHFQRTNDLEILKSIQSEIKTLQIQLENATDQSTKLRWKKEQ